MFEQPPSGFCFEATGAVWLRAFPPRIPTGSLDPRIDTKGTLTNCRRENPGLLFHETMLTQITKLIACLQSDVRFVFQGNQAMKLTILAGPYFQEHLSAFL